MKIKSLILPLLLLALGLGAFYLYKNPAELNRLIQMGESVSKSAKLGEGIIDSGSPQIAVPVYDKIPAATSGTAVLYSVGGAGFQTTVIGILQYAEKLISSKAAEKVLGFLKAQSPDPVPDVEALKASLNLSKTMVSSIEGGYFTANEDLSSRGAIVFRDEAAAAKNFEDLTGAKSNEPFNLSLPLVQGLPIDLTATLEGKEIKLLGVLKSDKKVELVTTAKHDDWSSMIKNTQPDSYAFSGTHKSALLNLIKNLELHTQETSMHEFVKGVLTSLGKSLEKISWVTSSASITDKIEGKYCESYLTKEDFVKSDTTFRSNILLSRVNPQTIFAFGATADSILAWLKETLSTVAASQKDEAVQTLEQEVKVLADKLKSLGISEIGMLAQSPRTTMEPEFQVVLGHAGALDAAKLSAALSDISKALDKELPPGEGATITNEGDIIVISQKGAPFLTGKAVDDKSFVFTTATEMGKPGPDAIPAEKFQIKGDISGVAYLSTTAVLPFVRQFIPLANMMLGEQSLTDPEINQFLSLIDFSSTLTINKAVVEDMTKCTNMQLGFVR